MQKKIKRFLFAGLLLGVLAAGWPIASSPDTSTAGHDNQIAAAPFDVDGNFDARPQGWPNPID